MEIKDSIKEEFLNTPVGESFYKIWDKATSAFEKDGIGATGVKAATALTFAVLEKLGEGKRPGDLTAAEWKEVAEKALNRAVFQDEQSYTVYIFFIFTSCFTGFAERAKSDVPREKVAAILGLAEKIGEKTDRLKEEQITETEYIEDCLWICLDATVKMLAAYAYIFGDDRAAEFAEAATAFAFEFGRCTFYRRELKLTRQFELAQHRADRELTEEYKLFASDLEKQAEAFSALIDNAFAPDFRERFAGSVALALSAGVSEGEILKTEAEVDSYFLE